MSDKEIYAGMTVNERLFDAGLLSEFDGAVLRRDIDKVRELLEAVCVDEESIKLTISNM